MIAGQAQPRLEAGFIDRVAVGGEVVRPALDTVNTSQAGGRVPARNA